MCPHAVEEQQQPDQDRHAEERRDAFHDRGEQDTHLGQESENSKQAHETQKSQDHRLALSERREPDDDEIENVPPSGEEHPRLAAVGGDAKPQFDGVNHHGNRVDGDSKITGFLGDPGHRQHGEEHRVRRDDGGDEQLEGAAVHESREPEDPVVSEDFKFPVGVENTPR